jgi:DNA uptake protein ComE-like DNA-binding protein
MTNENLTDDSLSDDTHVESADGESAVSNADTFSLSELNSSLGKTFKDKDSALKAVKDTFSFVGKRTETQAQSTPAVDTNAASKEELQTLKKELFFSTHPQFKDQRALIESLGDPAEVVERPEIKALFEKVKVADDIEQKKSVVHSSPHLAQTSDAIDKAIQVANATGSKEMTADILATAINDQFRQG